jgi:hypothetical protein
MSPSETQAERWLAKAGERSGATHNAPGSVNSRRSGDLPDNYGNPHGSFANEEYRAPRPASRYAAADSEVRGDGGCGDKHKTRMSHSGFKRDRPEP